MAVAVGVARYFYRFIIRFSRARNTHIEPEPASAPISQLSLQPSFCLSLLLLLLPLSLSGSQLPLALIIARLTLASIRPIPCLSVPSWPIEGEGSSCVCATEIKRASICAGQFVLANSAYLSTLAANRSSIEILSRVIGFRVSERKDNWSILS